jgi:hypothetical protein
MNLTEDCKALEIKHKEEQQKEKSSLDQANYQKALNELGIEVYYDA